MALDLATREFLDQVAAAGGPPLHQMTPDEARRLGAAMSERCGRGPDMARTETRELTSSEDGGSFDVRVFVPHDEPRALIVYLHGGGWVMGSLDGFDALARQLADRASAAVVLVGYRTAPEHPYPTALRDSNDALIWASEQCSEIAGRDVPLIVMGDSSGGNLAAVLCQKARDAAGPDIAMQVLLYPVTDCDFETKSYLAAENQLLLERQTMLWYWNHYLPDEAARTAPDASPLRADDLGALPPALVLTAEHDVLRDEGEAYASRLHAAGVPVTAVRVEGQMHGFFSMVNVLPGSATGMEMVVGAIADRLTAGPA